MVDQAVYWNGPGGERWVLEQVGLDAMLRPFGEAAMHEARVESGEAVLDVGCGCGDTSSALAGFVGARGRVVGLDVSARMLARARERSAGCSTVSFIEGDASTASPGPNAFDVVFSRFGVMFFSDPAGAFAHLRLALRPGGRVVFVCWRPFAENPWAFVPFEAAVKVLGRPEPEAPDGPGPFSFGDSVRVRSILEAAGFRAVAVRPFEAMVVFGAAGSLDDAVNDIVRLGPVARLLVDRDASAVARARSAIKAALPREASPHGAARFQGAAWIVTARNPG